MPQLTITQAKDKIWQAVVDCNNDGAVRTVELRRGENVLHVTVARTQQAVDEVV